MRKGPDDPLDAAVARMRATKAEHRRLLDVIASDTGMTPETRRVLVSHVLDEEDEQLDRIAGAATGEGGPAGPPRRGGLSVGSLRAEPQWPAARRGSIGSMRRD
jgi:hypothetical protein